jgi:hypothetical protein
VTLEKFHGELVKFYNDIKKKEKSLYNDGYKDAVIYILEWVEEYL